MVQRILVIDDEKPIQNVLERTLRQAGFEVISVSSGQEGLTLASEKKPDLMVLDLKLPDIPGEEICQKIRNNPKLHALPIMILTGKFKEGLASDLLNSGADDYVEKPFDLPELVARVRAILRRPRIFAMDKKVVQRGKITINMDERRAFFDGQSLARWAPKEFDLLVELVSRSPRVIDKNDLAMKAWGVAFDKLNRRTLDVHIRRIRQKLGPLGASFLKTVPTIGYQWMEDGENARIQQA
jgi:DNA-binding response OmpR family regulator